MSALEYQFPDPADAPADYLEVATSSFNSIVGRWDETSCNGGLKWQIYPENSYGYNYDPESTEFLGAMLLYHLVPGTWNVGDLGSGPNHTIMTSSLQGHNVSFLEGDKSQVIACGSSVAGFEIYNQLIGQEGVRFDLSKMSWIGKAATDARVVVVAAQSPVKTWQEFTALKEPVNFATAGLGSA